MILTGDSGTGLKPLSGELATVPIEAMAPVNVVAALVLHKAILYPIPDILSNNLDQIRIPPLEYPVT